MNYLFFRIIDFNFKNLMVYFSPLLNREGFGLSVRAGGIWEILGLGEFQISDAYDALYFSDVLDDVVGDGVIDVY